MSLLDVPSRVADSPTEPSSSSSAATVPDATPTEAPATSKPTTGTARSRGKGIKRVVPQATKIESVDDPMGPLGPLGDTAPPPPPQDDDAMLYSPPGGKPSASSNASLKTLMGSVNINDEDDIPTSSKARVPPPVQPAAFGDSPQRQTQPSVSIVEAAKPTFHINVGDPHKVGDLTTTHTEYQVSTRTTSKAYRNSEFTVSRRYKDFLWLYNQLHNNNPGIIVPPPPEKQAMGRFNVDFVESRRQALERMLNKAAAHPTLQHDGDLKLFLESEAFSLDIKHKERKEPLVQESKGVLSSIGFSSGPAKFVEHDDWFHDRRIYIDALENQLKALEKAVDTVVSQRKTLAEACGDFSVSLDSLAAVELSPSLSGALDGLAELQERVKDLYNRQAQQDVLTLGIVIDEYIRMCGSCKTAFGMREKSYYAWHAAEADLQKKKSTQEKLLRQGRSQTDRLNQLSAEVADSEKKAHQSRLLFDEMGRILRQELDRFDREKVEEFKSGVETYLESAVEAQKEV
jgi:sorting nexin-1/2